MITFTNENRLGFIPRFFSEWDQRPARDQLHTAYIHGGGVNPFEGFTLTGDFDNPDSYKIEYPGDPAYSVVGWARLREELILVFDHAWIAIVQPDESFIITHCD